MLIFSVFIQSQDVFRTNVFLDVFRSALLGLIKGIINCLTERKNTSFSLPLMLFGALTHRSPLFSLVSRHTFGVKTHHRASSSQIRKPCRRTHGFLSLSRVQDSAPARSPEAERSGPRHFAGFRRKAESVIVGNTTFAESAAPHCPSFQTELLYYPPENMIPRQAATA